MAVDLMALPLSRYWAGDYITPAMREAWRAGTPYAIVRPHQPLQQLPPDVPFGGPGACAERSRLLDVVGDLQGQLGITWDDSSNAEPEFFRVDQRSWSEFGRFALKLDQTPGLFARLAGRRPVFAHLAHATIFLPGRLPDLLAGEGFVMGSLPQAQAELGSTPWPSGAADAASTFRQAAAAARRLRFPLVVDM